MVLCSNPSTIHAAYFRLSISKRANGPSSPASWAESARRKTVDSSYPQRLFFFEARQPRSLLQHAGKERISSWRLRPFLARALPCNPNANSALFSQASHCRNHKNLPLCGARPLSGVPPESKARRQTLLSALPASRRIPPYPLPTCGEKRAQPSPSTSPSSSPHSASEPATLCKLSSPLSISPKTPRHPPGG